MKLKLGRFAYLHNRNVKCLHIRIKELPLSFSTKKAGPPSLIKEVYERLSLAPSHHHFFVSYLFILERLYTQYDKFMNRLDPVLDAPTIINLKLF